MVALYKGLNHEGTGMADKSETPMSRSAGRIQLALSRLRDIHVDMTVLQAMFFLHVAANPGITQRRLYKDLGTSDSVASRTVALLTDVGVRNSPPLGLVDMKLNPQDRREKFLTLTRKGERLLSDIMGDMKL